MPVTLLASTRSPSTLSVTLPGSTGPTTVRLSPSNRVKSPVTPNGPSVAIRLAGFGSDRLPAAPFSSPVATTPPGSVTAPDTASDSCCVAVSAPLIARSPVTFRLAKPALSGPVTASVCTSVSAKAPLVAKLPSVPIWLAPFSVAEAPLPVSPPTRIAPAPVSLIAPPLSRSSVPTVARLNPPAIVTGPPPGAPISSVAAFTGGAPPMPVPPPTVSPAWVSAASCTVPPGADSEPPAPNLGRSSAMAMPLPETAPSMASGVLSVSAKLPVVAKAFSAPSTLSGWVKLAETPPPVSVPAMPSCRLPLGWVIAPVALVVSAAVVSVPASCSAPFTPRLMLAGSVTGPVTTNPVLSARVKPPLLVNAASAAMALGPPVIDVVVPELPVSVGVTIAPPVWLIRPVAVSVSCVAAEISPAVCVRRPGNTPISPNALFAVNDTFGAVTVPESVSRPAAARLIEALSVTGPVTESCPRSVSVNPALVVKPASVSTMVSGPLNDAELAIPERVATSSVPLGWVIAPETFVVSAPVSSEPWSCRSPVTLRVIAVGSLTRPVKFTVRDWPSVSVSPPLLANVPRLAIMLAPGSVAAPPDDPVSVPAVIEPPVWVMAPDAVRLSAPGVLIAPPVSSRSPAVAFRVMAVPLSGPVKVSELPVRLTVVAAETVLLTVSGMLEVRFSAPVDVV